MSQHSWKVIFVALALTASAVVAKSLIGEPEDVEAQPPVRPVVIAEQPAPADNEMALPITHSIRLTEDLELPDSTNEMSLPTVDTNEPTEDPGLGETTDNEMSLPTVNTNEPTEDPGLPETTDNEMGVPTVDTNEPTGDPGLPETTDNEMGVPVVDSIKLTEDPGLPETSESSNHWTVTVVRGDEIELITYKDQDTQAVIPTREFSPPGR